MTGAIEIQLFNFTLIYLLLAIVLFIMKKAGINRSKQLIIASIRMSIQLMIISSVFVYVFTYPRALYTIIALTIMITFAYFKIISNQEGLNPRFKRIILFSIMGGGLFVLFYFVGIVININPLNPRYTITLAGMIIGNAMTGMNVGIRTFMKEFKLRKAEIKTMINLGVEPKVALFPIVRSSFEVALLPTMNTMVGTGIVFLPGMMTGQILAGSDPRVAIMYQIAVLIAICVAVALCVYLSLYFGYQTLYDEKKQVHFDE